jgi:hypothetical protein
LGATLPGEKPEANGEEPADNVRYLARRKANYSPKDWRRMTYADGALTPELPDAGIIHAIKAGNAEKTLLAGLATLTARGIHTSDGQRAANYLPRALADYKLNNGLRQNELVAAMRAMVLDGRLQREQIGRREKNRNPIYGLTVKPSGEAGASE